ncbi:hypothetical protein [Polaromonas sp.]|uniref:hypothetical protein n=1 Tax=Polaromonas sp. TaxID=1869339 RepID=UPI003BAD8D75
MDIRFISKPLVGLAVLWPLWSSIAQAQTPAAPPPANAPAQAAPAPFRSALENYQPYTDEKTAPWKAANEQVDRNGGWRAYAKEGRAAASPAAAPQADPHAGHAKP